MLTVQAPENAVHIADSRQDRKSLHVQAEKEGIRFQLGRNTGTGSMLFLDGKAIEWKEKDFLYTCRPGEHTIGAVLYDESGEILENTLESVQVQEGTEEILLTSGGKNIDNTLHVNAPVPVEMEYGSDGLKMEVTADGRAVETDGRTFTVQPQMKTVCVKLTKADGTVLEKSFSVEAEAKLDKAVWIEKNKAFFQFDLPEGMSFYLMESGQKIPLKSSMELVIPESADALPVFSEDGNQLFEIRKDDIVLDPSLEIESQLSANGPARLVNIAASGYEELSVQVSENGKVREEGTQFLLEGREDERVLYHVAVKMKDLSGKILEKELDVEIDRRTPVLELTSLWQEEPAGWIISAQSRHAESLQLFLWEEDGWKEIEEGTLLKGRKNQLQIFTVKAEMVDVFGQKHVQEKTLEADLRIPSLQIAVQESGESAAVAVRKEHGEIESIRVSGGGEEKDYSENFTLFGRDNSLTVYEIEAVMVDVYQNRHTEKQTVAIDRRKPSLQLEMHLEDGIWKGEALFEHEKSVQIQVESDQKTETVSSKFQLSGRPDALVRYTIKATMEDVFGNLHTVLKEAEVDRRVPQLQLNVTQASMEKSAAVHVEGSHYQTLQIHVLQDGGKEIYTEDFTLHGEEGRRYSCQVQAIMADVYGKVHVKEETVVIDRRNPDGKLLFNGKEVQEGGNTVFSVFDSASFQSSGDVSAQYLLNGERLPAESLGQALAALQEEQVLEVQYTVRMENGRENIQRYFFQWKKLSAQGNYSLLNTETSTVYALSQDGFLSMESRQQTEQPPASGFRILHDYASAQEKDLKVGEKVRLFVDNPDPENKRSIVSLRINNETIDPSEFRQDALGNQYYDFLIQEESSLLEMEIQQEDGTSVIHTRKLQAERNHWVSIAASFLLLSAGIFAVFLIRCRKSLRKHA